MNRCVRPGVMATAVLVAALFSTATMLSAADVSVGSLQIYSRGYMQSGALQIDTRTKFDLSVGGGYKFGAKLSFGMDTTNADFAAVPSTAPASTILQRVLLFNGAEVTAKRLLGTRIGLTYFVGLNDIFGSGSVFSDRFGTEPVGTDFGGYLTYPTPPAIEYDGVYRVSGTGIRVSIPSDPKGLLVDGYLYTDAYLGTGVYAADLRIAVNTEPLKVAAFAGASFPQSPYGLYRAGFFLFAKPTDIAQFLVALGLPYWSPADGFSAQQLYVLFEPRLRLNPFSIIVTVFWHPSYYLESATNEGGAFDANLRFQIGNELKDPAVFGIDGLLTHSSTGGNAVAISASPFLRINATGVIWDFKIAAQLIPFDFQSLFTGYIGIRTEF